MNTDTRGSKFYDFGGKIEFWIFIKSLLTSKGKNIISIKRIVNIKFVDLFEVNNFFFSTFFRYFVYFGGKIEFLIFIKSFLMNKRENKNSIKKIVKGKFIDLFGINNFVFEHIFSISYILAGKLNFLFS